MDAESNDDMIQDTPEPEVRSSHHTMKRKAEDDVENDMRCEKDETATRGKEEGYRCRP